MSVNILAVGDITGQSGLDILSDKLRVIKKQFDIAFTVVNGENASGLGVTKKDTQVIFDAGADVITLGNHTWSKIEICKHLDDSKYLLRPANFAPQVPGAGWGVFEASFGKVCVINLIGRVDVQGEFENPFLEADKILKKVDEKVILIDFHACATSEKTAMAYHLDGRATALWGTHTHVQTSDCRVFPNGLGYITDLGMTGPLDSVIGMKPQNPVSHFLGNPTERFVSADGPSRIEGAVFEIDPQTGKCISVEAIRIQ
ncbi:MAG: TIGR00282 family metallophosphoesterase [Oscillospiraceae bacterium]|nr:TIGR00282 family metallophosphoesterase [Oscillospiraceae bacterium]